MFTDNYIKYREMMFYGIISNSNTFTRVDGVSIKAAADVSARGDIGTWVKLGRCLSFVATGSNEDYVSAGVYFGSGSTPAARTDYKLESPITSGLTITNPSSVVTEKQKDHKYILHSTFLVKNTSGSEKIIWEVGVFTPVRTDELASEPAHLVLMDRVVLSTPITILPGETKAITYKFICRHLYELE